MTNKKLFSHIQIIYGTHKTALFKSLLFMVITSSLTAFFPYFIAKIVDALKDRNGHVVIGYIVGSFELWFVNSVLIEYYHDLFDIRNIDFNIKNTLFRYSLKKYFDFSIGQHAQENSGIALHVMKQGEGSVEEMLRVSCFNLMPVLIDMLVTTVIVSYFSLLIGGLLLIANASYIAFTIRMQLVFLEPMGTVRKTEQDFEKNRTEQLRNVRLVLTEGRENYAQDEAWQMTTRYTRYAKRVWKKFAMYAAAQKMILGVMRFVSLGIAAYFIYQGRYTIGSFAMFYGWITSINGNLNGITKISRQLITQLKRAEKYFAVMEKQPDIVETPEQETVQEMQGQISFRNICFSYADLGYAAPQNRISGGLFNDLSFTISPKQITGIAGKSGSGKSTILQLIIRAFDPQSGDVYLDGRNVKDIKKESLRQCIAFVQQDTILFDQTIEYNLLYGLGGAGGDRKLSDYETMIVSSLGLSHLINNTHANGHAKIGENGSKLSGGERQRIGIARALIKKPDILLLDECTSALDGENEALVMDTVRRVMRDKTVVIISHRISTIEQSDHILVLRSGEITACGTHSDLVTSSHYYRELMHADTTTIKS